jgi:hypothetical protein
MTTTDVHLPKGVLTGVVLGLGSLTSMLAIMALSARVLQVRTTSLTPTFPVGDWVIRDLGSNLPGAALLSVGALGLGMAAWGLGGFRWAVGLIVGSALSIVAWSALVLGLIERPVNQVQIAVTESTPIGTEVFVATIERSLGSTLVVLVAILALATAVTAAFKLRPDTRNAVNPLVAAVGAVAAMGVAIGPLLPTGSAGISDNFSAGLDQPALFLLGRLTHLGIIAICGVGGFLMVQTAGLGIVAGNLTLTLWLTYSVLTDNSPNAVGPGVTNPGGWSPTTAFSSELHSITLISGAAMAIILLGATGAALIRHLTSHRTAHRNLSEAAMTQ